MDNGSIAEHHQRQRQKVAEKDREESYAFLHSITLVGAKGYAGSVHDIRSQSDERGLCCAVPQFYLSDKL